MDRRQEAQSTSLIERGRNKLIATGVIAALGIGALAGCSTDAKAEGPAPTETTQSVEPTPATPAETETPAPTETEPTTEGLISPEKAEDVTLEALNANMTSEELGNQIEKITQAWLFHGSLSKEDAEHSMMQGIESNMSVDEYNEWKTNQAAELYAPLIFGQDWQESLQTDEASLSGTAELLEILNANTKQNLINALGRYGTDEPVPSIEYSASDFSDEVSDTLDEGERGLLYSVHYEFVNANNDDSTEDARFGYVLKEQPDGTLAIVGRAVHEIPQTD